MSLREVVIIAMTACHHRDDTFAERTPRDPPMASESADPEWAPAGVGICRSISVQPTSWRADRTAGSHAYERWTEDEDDALTDAYLDGVDVDRLAEIHGRLPGGIRSRLVLLGLAGISPMPDGHPMDVRRIDRAAIEDELRAMLHRIGRRSRAILIGRELTSPPASREVLAEQLGITPKRVMQLERPAIKRVRNMVARHATPELQYLVREATEVCRSYRSSAVPVEFSRHLPEGLNPIARVLIGRLGGVPAPAPAEARRRAV
jgi:hypothetical protein